MLQFQDVLWEGVATAGECAAQGIGGLLVRAGRPADAKINAAWKECCQGAELFGDDKRCMIRQHDAAGTNADGRGYPGDLTDHHGSRSTGDADHVVMFRQPIARVAPCFRMRCEVQGIEQCLTGITTLDDGRQIKNGKRRLDHEGHYGP